ncbi:G patch domain-containing protein 11, variant 2 [Balamuthia mandrillaris]
MCAEQKRAQLGRPLKVREKEKLKEGLATAISSENVGFRLLQKMGYKEGKGLGKQEAGITEPVALEADLDRPARSGLGRGDSSRRATFFSYSKGEDEEQDNVNNDSEPKKKRVKTTAGSASIVALQDSFKERVKNRFEEKKIEGQWRKCLALCATLEQQKREEKNEGKDRDRDEASQYLLLFEEQQRKKEARRKEIAEHGRVTSEELLLDADEALSFDEKSERLAQLLHHLRTEHLYCFFCGCSFESEAEMLATCPGPLEHHHEDGGGGGTAE